MAVPEQPSYNAPQPQPPPINASPPPYGPTSSSFDPVLPGAVPPGAVPPRKSGCKKWVACGCAVPILLVIGLIFAATRVENPFTSTPTGKQSTLPPTKYTGDWMAQDGSTISIRADGTAGFVSGNTKVSGGGTTIDEKKKTLEIEGLFGLGKTWKIDQPPRDNNGISEMKLSGIVFRRSGGFDPDGSVAADGVPSNKVLRGMAQQTLLDFNRALQTKNFTSFHATLSGPFKEQTTPQTFNNAFKTFIAQKLDISSIKNVPPTFSPQPSIDSDGYLSLQGFYPTRPLRVNFILKYYREDGAWKLIRIEVNVKKAP